MKLSANAITVLKNRYLRKDAQGKVIESPVDMFSRVSHAIAQAELRYGNERDAQIWEERFFHMLSRLEFLPNSPTLMNAGTSLGQLSACFVLPVEDSLHAIFNTLHLTALIQQSGGGTGFNFSHLRPAGDLVLSTSGRTSGPLSFMQIFDTTTNEIRQGGKRRGANMGILNIDHPDIEAFISSKCNDHVLQNFNLSVAITDTFMQALKNKRDWSLKHPVTGKTVRRIPAHKLWKTLVHSAWQSGDPGLIFIDEIRRHNPTPSVNEIEATNPCGEVPLLPYESCNLGSVNLSHMVVKRKSHSEINWDHLAQIVKTGIRFLDNVLDVNNYVIPEIKEITLGNRKIGLGVMGWADLLIQLDVPYDSQQAVKLAHTLMQFIQQQSRKASMELAQQRGMFPNWKRSVHYPALPLRNATMNSIAPTGSISIIADASSSIEPYFAFAWHRKTLDNQELSDVSVLLKQKLRSSQHWKKHVEEQLRLTGSIAGIKDIPSELKRLFRTALEISPQRHLAHQLAFQRYTDNAVSKTINLPNNATPETVEMIYLNAWEGEAKGITVYRDGSKAVQVLYAGAQEEDGLCCSIRDSSMYKRTHA